MKCKQIIRNKKIFLPLILLLGISFNTIGQSFYRLQFEYPELNRNSIFNAFLIQYDDNDGIVRIGYFDSSQQKNIITECQIQLLSQPNNLNSNNYIIKLVNPKSIQGVSSIDFELFAFILKSINGGQMKLPVSVASLSSNGTILKSKDFIAQNSLAESELNEKVLDGLFLSDEPIYKNYTKAKSRGGFNWGRTIPTLHVYILADFFDENIGAGCMEDQKKLIQFYTTVASRLKIRLDTVTIANNRYNRKGVQMALDSLKPGIDDIVVFHYTGHGFNRDDPSDPYPNLFLMPYSDRPVFFDTLTKGKAKEKEEALRNATLSIQEIYKVIVSKGARLNCVFSDCCNTDYNLHNVPMIDDGKTKRGFLTLYPDYCKKLFIDERVSFLATATKKGEQAASNDRIGSLYTDNYLQILGKYLTPAYNGSVDDVNWNSVLINTVDMTKQKAPTIYNRLTKAAFIMSPFFDIQKK